jgi:hypothetical protein
MTMSVIDNVLEEFILEDLLLELSEVGGADVRIEVTDDAPSTSFPTGRETTPPVCHASPAPEGAPVREDAPSPEGVAEDDPTPRV